MRDCIICLIVLGFLLLGWTASFAPHYDANAEEVEYAIKLSKLFPEVKSKFDEFVADGRLTHNECLQLRMMDVNPIKRIRED